MLAASLLGALVTPLAVAEDLPIDDGDDAEVVLSGPSGRASPRAEQKSGAENLPRPLADDREAEASARRWAIPPIPWQAQFGLDVDRYRFAEADLAGTTSARLSASASSFVFAPWFLGLSGGASFSRGQSTGGSETESANGNISANVVPMSRFPATVSAGVGKTRSTGPSGVSSGGFKNFNWGQRYRPEDASFNSDLNYSWNQFGQDGPSGNVTSQSLTGNASLQVSGDIPQTLSYSGSASGTKNDLTGDGSALQTLGVNHSLYLEDYVMSVTSDAGINRSVVKGADAGDAMSLIVGTSIDWIPSDDYPLRLQGAARHHSLRNNRSDGSLASALDSTSLNLNATYPLNKNWSLSGAGFAIRSADTVGQVTSYGLSSSLGWGGDGVSRDFDAWNYALSYRAAMTADYSGARSQQGGSSARAGATITAGAEQRFARGFAQEAQDLGSASVQFSQGLDVTQPVADAGGQAGASLTHGAAYTWTRAPASDSSVAATVSARDGRSFGAGRSSYQEIAAYLNGAQQVNARESFSWSVGAPLSRQATPGLSGRWQGSVSGSLSYGNARFANVTGLVYAANYNVGIQPQPSDGGRVSQGVVVRQLLTQSWSWRLGLLGWKVGNEFSRNEDGRLTAAIRLSVTRDFGGVL